MPWESHTWASLKFELSSKFANRYYSHLVPVKLSSHRPCLSQPKYYYKVKMSYFWEGRSNILKHSLKTYMIIILSRSWPSLIKEISLIFMIINLDFSSQVFCEGLTTNNAYVSFRRKINGGIRIIGWPRCSSLIIVVFLEESQFLCNYCTPLIVSAKLLQILRWEIICRIGLGARCLENIIRFFLSWDYSDGRTSPYMRNCLRVITLN